MKSNTLHGMEREKQMELHSERNEVNTGSSNGKPILADNVGLQDAFYSRFMHTSTLDGSELAHAELVSIAILIDFNWQPALADFIDSQGHVPWMQF